MWLSTLRSPRVCSRPVNLSPTVANVSGARTHLQVSLEEPRGHTGQVLLLYTYVRFLSL